MTYTERVCWLTVGFVAFMVMVVITTYQQNTIRTMLDTQGKMVEDYKQMSVEIQTLRRQIIIGAPIERINKLERQVDIVTAATRSGWAQAHRLIREGVFE